MLTVFVCIHACVYTYVCRSTCTSVYMLMRVRGRCLVSSLFTLVFESGSLTEPRLAVQQAPGISYFYLPSAGTIGVHCYSAFLKHGCWGLNSDSHACIPSTLLAESSLQSPVCFYGVLSIHKIDRNKDGVIWWKQYYFIRVMNYIPQVLRWQGFFFFNKIL